MAKSTRKATGKSGTPTTEDITHEEVSVNQSQPAKQELRVLTQEEMIDLELRKLSPADQKLNELYTKFEGLAIKGPDDKEGYRLVKEAWRETLTFRTGVENTALAMRRDYTAINKAIASKEGQLVGRAKPLEEKLQKMWKAIDDERERAEKEEEARLERQLEERLGKLTNAGAKYDDGYYVIGDTVTFDVATLRSMTEDKFEKLLKVVQDTAAELKAQADKKQQEEQQRKEQEERERQEARKAIKETRSMIIEALGLVQTEGSDELVWTDGEHRLVVSANNLYDLDHYGFTQHIQIVKDNIRNFQESKRIQEQEKQERQERIARENRWKSRMLALQQAGLTHRAGDFIYNDGFNRELKVFGDELAELEDAAFNEMVIELSNEVGKYRQALLEKQREDHRKQEELNQRKSAISAKMQELGFRYIYNQDAFEFNNPLYMASWTSDQLLGMQEAGLASVYASEAQKIAAARVQLQQQEREKLEEQEQERLAGLNDAQRFKEYIESLKAVKAPVLNTTTGKNRAAQFLERFTSLCNDFQPKFKKEVQA